ncbi:MAG: transglutaminaseTgpA domain-containing protein, partial [Acidimicrobiia bacterium]|nr:transglutaminaseTgpA domain-containing protein [Acidimicrobiia bacterium]
MFLPPTIMYLQFAVFDRSNAGLGWLLPSTVVIGLGLLTMAFGRRDESGRARDTDGRPVPRKTIGLAAITAAVVGVASLALADAASLSISEYGMAPWRGGTGVGEGPGGGGIGFDGLVDLRQRVLNLSETPVFEATFGPGAPPGDQVYWRMEALDEFTGAEWRRSDASLRRFEPGIPFALETNVYRGTSYEFSQVVVIRQLRGDLAPAAGVPVSVQEVDSSQGRSARFPTEFNSLGDAALAVNGGLDRNDTYQLRTVAADRTADVGAMATTDSGVLSPIFAGAVAAGEVALQPTSDLPEPVQLPDRERYLQVPPDTPPSLAGVAARETRGATTDFERAWMLQSWFRDSGDFTYTTDVDTGHSALRLDDWLSDPDSTNFRQGYCEQFAAAMGVLLRLSDIPSRVVWGFTPGVIEEQENGTPKVVVRETNAHAWVEAWIEPFGWVEFDPTPRGEFQPPSLTAAFDPAEYVPERDFGPIIPPDVSDFGEDLELVDPSLPVDGTRTVRWWLIGLVLAIPIVLIVPGYKRLRRRRRLARLREGDITAAWDEVVDRLTDLGIPPAPSATPLEAARATD